MEINELSGQKEKNTIEKKVAAQEVYNTRGKFDTIALTSIGAVFVTAVAGIYSKVGGAICAGVYSAGCAWFVFHNRKAMQYLKQKYSLEPINKKAW